MTGWALRAGGESQRVGRRLLLVLVLLTACSGKASVPDAGDEAFVRRLVPVMTGRLPHGLAEVAVWTDLVAATDRATVVRALGRSPETQDRWQELLLDFVSVRREGAITNARCYRDELLAPGPELAAFVRDGAADGAPFPSAWTMADLARSAVILGDLSPFFRAHLLTAFGHRRNQAQTWAEGLSYRKTTGELFLASYTQRSHDCLPCHNGRFSVTDDPDPALDRHWPLRPEVEEALFGDAAGGDVDRWSAFFRRYGVVAGYQFTSQIDGWPPAPDRGCIQSYLPGCNGCACETAVCGQRPSCCGSDWDATCASLCFTAAGSTCHDPPTLQPWGVDPLCGPMTHPDSLIDDLDGVPGYFGREYGADVSVWDLERSLRQGLTTLGDEAPDEAPLAPEAAFAHLLASTLADRVFAEALGAPLTQPHGFSRNEAQRDLLASLTETVITSRFSLVELLVAITATPIFNAAAPPKASRFAALLDPFTVESEEPEERDNGFGELLHRTEGRALLRTVHGALGWRMPRWFPGRQDRVEDDNLALQEALGISLKDADPGSRGLGFQAMLAWEEAYGSCRDGVPRNWGCAADPLPGCPDCPCEAEVCAAREECCLDLWDADCAALCAASDAGCAETRAEEADFIDAVLAEGGTLGEAIATVKDRLLADPTLSADEERTFATLTGEALDAPATEDALRAACGVLLSAPGIWLRGDPGPDRLRGDGPPLVPPGSSYRERCEAWAPLLEREVECGEEGLTLP